MARPIVLAGLCVFAIGLAACAGPGTATTAPMSIGSSVQTTSQLCHGKSFGGSGNLLGRASSKVQVVAAWKPKVPEHIARTVPFELGAAYASCIYSVSSLGSQLVFTVQASATPADLRYLVHEIEATGHFEMVSEQPPS